MKRQMERRGLIWLLVLALAALLCACGQTAGSDAAPGSPAAAPEETPPMSAEQKKVVAEIESDAASMGQAPGPEELRDPVALLERLDRQGWHGRCRLLPYQAVGVECGMLLALRLDGARVGAEEWGRLLLALSPTPLSDGGGYCALIGT